MKYPILNLLLDLTKSGRYYNTSEKIVFQIKVVARRWREKFRFWLYCKVETREFVGQLDVEWEKKEGEVWLVFYPEQLEENCFHLFPFWKEPLWIRMYQVLVWDIFNLRIRHQSRDAEYTAKNTHLGIGQKA